jgi:hypothetical protein
MILKMHLIQFALIVNWIQMKLMKVIHTRENMMSQEFQHCSESRLKWKSFLCRLKNLRNFPARKFVRKAEKKEGVIPVKTVATVFTNLGSSGS